MAGKFSLHCSDTAYKGSTARHSAARWTVAAECFSCLSACSCNCCVYVLGATPESLLLPHPLPPQHPLPLLLLLPHPLPQERSLLQLLLLLLQLLPPLT